MVHDNEVSIPFFITVKIILSFRPGIVDSPDVPLLAIRLDKVPEKGITKDALSESLSLNIWLVVPTHSVTPPEVLLCWKNMGVDNNSIFSSIHSHCVPLHFII